MSEEEYNIIDRRLQRLEEKLDVIMDAVTREAAMSVTARARLDGMYKTVYGNGTEGLISRVAHLEASRRFWASTAAAAMGLVIGSLLTVLTWLLDR